MFGELKRWWRGKDRTMTCFNLQHNSYTLCRPIVKNVKELVYELFSANGLGVDVRTTKVYACAYDSIAQ